MIEGVDRNLYDNEGGLNSKSLSEQSVPNGRPTFGIGYVMIPSDVDRDLYVESCIRKSKVSIMTEQGEFINDVPVGKLTMQFIDFPNNGGGKDSRTLGSPVSFATLPNRNKPLILDVYNATDDFEMNFENSFSFSRKTGTSSAMVMGNGSTGDIIINSTSNNKNGVNINVKNKNSEGYFKMIVDGITDIFTRKSLKLKTGTGIFVEVKDDLADYNTDNEKKYTRISIDNGNFIFQIDSEDKSTRLLIDNGDFIFQTGKVDSDGNFIESETSSFTFSPENAVIGHLKKVTLGKGSEPMLLGDTTASLISDLITACSNITTLCTPNMTQPTINKAEFEALKLKVEKIKSAYGFLE